MSWQFEIADPRGVVTVLSPERISLHTAASMAPALLILVLLCFSATGLAQELEARRTSLAQLPLEKLLHVKHALAGKDYHEKGDNLVYEEGESGALPLRSSEWEKRRKKQPARRGDSWDDEKESKGKGEIASIFQSTVTVLSFLAFGGYLLCLIVQALKTGQTAQNPNVVVPTQIPAGLVGKKRKRRTVEDSMLQTLHRIAEAYAVYSLSNQDQDQP